MEKLLLVDGHSILSRAFFGIPRLTTGDGMPTNAVYGFLNILLKVISDEKPDYISVAFDLDRSKLKRTQIFPEYKGTRKPMPEDLHVQVPVIQELLKKMNLPVITLSGYEADDILGTLAMKNAGTMDVTILSGDRDLLQLARENIKIVIPKTSKGVTESFSYYPEDVKREYGVTPTEFIDVKALMGDTSDNIPGLPGVGEKTAGEIISKYGSIENAYSHAGEVTPPRAKTAFLEHYDLAVLSKLLATIDTDAPVETDVTAGKTEGIYTGEAVQMLRELELKTLVTRFQSNQKEETAETRNGIPEYTEVSDPFKASVVFSDCLEEKSVGLSLYDRKGNEDPVQLSFFDSLAEVTGTLYAGICLNSERVYLLRSGDGYPYARLKKDLENLFISLIKKNVEICCISGRQQVRMFPVLREAVISDVSIASYLLNPLRENYTFDSIAKDHLGLILEDRRELCGKQDDNNEKIQVYEAYVSRCVSEICRKKLNETGMLKLYQDVELPLSMNLLDMENAGIRIDRKALKRYSGELKSELTEIEEQIFALTEDKFNLNSPVQLGQILFEKLQIKGGKKTKKGYSTSADILEKVKDEHPVVPLILRYRTLSKLNSTYALGLDEYIGEDGRIHGKFHQTVTATGRISSADPNLQNIPVRTEEGREIRKVFIPTDGFVFVDADYSQVELRILASLSGDENLIAAYRNSEDIHTSTAARVFHVETSRVTPEMRRNAKAVNFGIVYGISAFGLGEGLSISRKEALEYINTYFETYPKVKAYLDGQVAVAKEKGYVTTAFGRIRPVPEIRSSNYMERSFGERIAMNSPIQGTAADIIKIAMNRVADRLKTMKSKIVLQVHDELLLEATPEETDAVKEILKYEMEHAADLPVPLCVEVCEGRNWNECH